MARESNSPLTSVQSVLSLAANRRETSQDLPAAMLELAAALIQADNEINCSQTSAGDHGAKDLNAVFDAWANVSAQLLSAIARPLGELQSIFSGGCYSTHQQNLVAAAERLAQQTRQSSEVLQQVSNELKSESRALMLRAGAVGLLSRALQKERLRLSQHLQRAQELDAEIAQAKTSQAETFSKVEALQERLRIAIASESEIQAFEQQVLQKEQDVRKKTQDLEHLEKRRDKLEEERQALPERIEKTKRLIEQLEQSGDPERIRLIQQIWKLVSG